MRAPLSDWQLTVLRWITSDGRPSGVMTGFTYKTTAVALQNRHLVIVSKRGGVWSAELTSAGRHYLDHGRYPGPEAKDRPRRNAQTAPPAAPAAGGNNRAATTQPPAEQPNTPAAVKRKGPTELLVEAVLAAGGCLPVDRSETPAYTHRQRIAAAERYGKVPAGKRLTARIVAWPGMEIRLVDRPDTVVAPPQEAAPSVPVPERVARYHPVAARFRDEKERHEVSAASLGRALRIVQALVVEAERRGYHAENVTGRNEYGSYTAWSGSRDGHVSVRVRNHSTALRIQEEGLPSRRHWQRTHWASKEKYPATGSGQLKIEFCGYCAGNRQSHWADRKKWRLEDKLPDILREPTSTRCDTLPPPSPTPTRPQLPRSGSPGPTIISKRPTPWPRWPCRSRPKPPRTRSSPSFTAGAPTDPRWLVGLVTFVTTGELTKWAEIWHRSAQSRREVVDRLSGIVVLRSSSGHRRYHRGVTEQPLSDGEHLADIVRQAAASGTVVYLTDRGQRLAAIVPPHLAELLERAGAPRERRVLGARAAGRSGRSDVSEKVEEIIRREVSS